ncbi:CAP domain-containing protein [Bacillus mexicanus]|uniref:CAP domain-containing protein n=1 Tax=Bacillus mexicanus TaxID=2834415 RepID=UPI003D1CCB9A
MRKFLLPVLFLAIAFSFAIHHTKAEASEITTINYVVKDGETVNIIANRYQMGSDEIGNVNPGVDINQLKTGQTIKIPDLSEIKSLQNEVIRLTNIERQKVGIAPLTYDWKLGRVARYKANDMRDNNYFSHYSPTYGDPFVMMRDFGISFTKAGENIAARQTTPEQVVQSWMNSDSHREAMLNPDYTRIGAGYSEGGYLGYYWVQMFAN